MYSQLTVKLNRQTSQLVRCWSSGLIGAALFSLILTTPLLGQRPHLRFFQLTQADGLPHQHVTSVVQDSTGMIWIGTRNGLARFDGYSLTNYSHRFGQPNGLASITSLLMHSKRLWVASRDGGIHVYLEKKDVFQKFQLGGSVFHPANTINGMVANGQSLMLATQAGLCTFTLQKPSGIPNSDESLFLGAESGSFFPEEHVAQTYPFERLFRDRKNVLWLVRDGELYFISPGEHELQAHLPHLLSEIRCIFEDKQGQLWLGGARGSIILDADLRGVVKYFDGSHQAGFPGDITAINQDGQGRMWLGSNTQGLVLIEDPYTDLYQHWPVTASHMSMGGPATQIESLFVDRSENLWLATRSGLVWCNPHTLSFGNYRLDETMENSVSSGINCFDQDDNQQIWLGGEAGLFRWDVVGNQLEAQAMPSHLTDIQVYAMTHDLEGNLWLGMRNQVVVFNPQLGFGASYVIQPNQLDRYQGGAVSSLIFDRKGNLWLASVNSGLYQLERGGDQLLRFSGEKAKTLFSDSINCLLEDSREWLWIGSQDGLYFLDPLRQMSGHIRAKPGVKSGLQNGNITSLFQDREQHLWAGTDKGLHRVDVAGFPHNKTISFQCFGTSQGLASEHVRAIGQGEFSVLWLSTAKGLAYFDSKQNRFTNYSPSQGLQGTDFRAGAVFKDRQGRLFFGGSNGFNCFDSTSLKESKLSPPIVLSNLLIANKVVLASSDGPLKQPLHLSTSLRLNHLQKMVSFEFAALDFLTAKQSRYRYQLHGFDMVPIETSADHRLATYTNLDPGNYSFQVTGSDGRGNWNTQGARVDLIVLPPPWRTWWALLGYCLFLALVVWWLLRIGKLKRCQQAEILRQQKLLVEKDRANNQRLQHLNLIKDQFLSNTSHELLMPLIGMVSIVESLYHEELNTLQETARTNLAMVVASGKRLISLVGDLSDIAKLKRGDIHLNLMAVDLHNLVDVILSLTQPLVEHKQLNLINAVPHDLPHLQADPNRLQQILHNLVDNAVRFTRQGHVEISAHLNDQNGVTVSVEDTGVGMAQQKQVSLLDHLQNQGIDHFQSQERELKSSGLGLAITQSLIRLHGGMITLHSEQGQGSIFSFNLKISAETAASPETFASKGTGTSQSLLSFHEAKAHILVVDDEPINRRVLVNHLCLHDFQLTVADNGSAALKLFDEGLRCDLVLLDVMMPKLTGYQVCEKIRKKFTMEEMPIIFLTARNQVPDLVAAFQSGGNDFLAKPVAREELLARVRTHLHLLQSSRFLEQKVVERTKELHQSNAQLQARNHDLVKAQNQLILSEKLASLGTLASSVAHEFNKPNSLIKTSVQNLDSNHSELKKWLLELKESNQTQIEQRFDRLHEQIEHIQNGTHRIAEVVENLHRFIHPQLEGRDSFDVLEGLRTTVALVRAGYKDVEIVLDLGAPLHITCRPEALNQVFLNLILNGIEAIRCRRFEEGENAPAQLRIISQRLKGRAQIRFCDTGTGILPEHEAHIFEVFFSTKKGGSSSGLGLYTVWQVLEQHGGRIEMSTQPGNGSVFTIQLPMENEPQ